MNNEKYPDDYAPKNFPGCSSQAEKNCKAPAPRFCGAAYLSDPLRVELMTMNYCGRCGSANGATARFCRQCGADFSSQAAASSSAPPFNVELSGKPVMK